MPFAGMVGRMLAQTMLRGQIAKNAAKGSVNMAGGYRGAFSSSGKYLFVAHPNCCPKCTQMNGTLWNTPDVAFISHPNCMCATIEAPAGLSPSELMDWTKSPVGVMRFGFNYGQSLKPVQLRHENRDKVFAQWQNRMDPFMRGLHPRRQVRARVSQEQIDAIRAKVKSGELTQGTDLTRRVQGLVKAMETRRQKKALRRHVEDIRNNGAGLRKGAKWIPSRVKTRTEQIDTGVSPRNYRGNTVELPRNNRGISTVSQRNLGTSDMRSAIRALGGFASLAKKNKKRREEREREETFREMNARNDARKNFMRRRKGR